MDVGIAVEHLLGVAEYGSASDYAALVRTWRDPRPLPTLQALEAAWQEVLAARDAAATLKAAILTTARGAEGKLLNALSAAEVRALMAILLWKAGGVAENATVKPLESWT